MPLVKRTLATFRKAEFGFLGVTVKTFKQTPRLNGEGNFFGRFFKTLKANVKAGLLPGFFIFFLPFLISCLIVGIFSSKKLERYALNIRTCFRRTLFFA